jgi:filamentous hemagglutinin
VIQPQFHAAFPQFTFKYSGSATGLAIQAAENGTGGPSALIVHAPSLENQFVAGGFSLNNQFGNAIFYNDFILAGPSGGNDATHANVASNASNNIAQAFADIATAGNGATATFESRGGSSNAPGTTVAEHGIWSTLNGSGLKPPDSVLVLCNVSAADGGGMTPIKSSVQATSGQDCPDSGTVSQADAPSWYLINTGNQANNVNVANACTAAPGGANSCYVFTDRGTYDFLSSSNSPSAPNGIPNLTIVTRNNSASAPGGANALINYFHVYIINPTKPGETVNVPAAQDFVNFLTSPAFQAQVKVYLNSTTDPGGAPFIPTAAPTITQSGLPSTVAGGKTVTVTGTVTNAEPAWPALSGKTVSLDQFEGGLPVHVATGTTDASGHYSITFTPTSSGTYQVSTGQISQIEIPALNPAYGDLLSPAATAAGAMNVQASVSITSANSSSGGATVAGKVAPGAPDANATVTVLARPQGSKGRFTNVGGETLAARQSTYAASASLPPGKWEVETSFQDPGQILGATSTTKNVTVLKSTTSASFGKVTVKNGKLTVNGTLSQAQTANGTQVKLFALSTHGASASFKQVGKATVRAGKTKFTIHAKLKRGFVYALQLEFVHKGEPSTFSRLRTVNVR